jgi:isochorismate synthase
MKVLENQLSLYVGGGITADSVPEDEWEETEIKAETLLSVLNQIK